MAAELSAIVRRLAADLGAPAGDPIPLDGGITNRNFRVRFADRECVIRLPGKDTGLLGIDRAAERAANAAAARLGIAPPVVFSDDECLVTEFVAGAPFDPDRLRAAPEAVGRALRAFHDSGTELPVRFWVPELLDDYARIVTRLGGAPPSAYRRTQELVARIASVLPLADPVACHDDLLPGNLMVPDRDPESALLVDWEYAGMGHRLFDLGNLAVNNAFDDGAEDRLLAAYDGRPPTRGRRAQLKLFRLVSDAREAAWGVVQGRISELTFDFAEYAETHFARLEHGASDPRLEGWLSDAATA